MVGRHTVTTRGSRVTPLRAAVLVLALLVAETFATVHPLDLDAHSSGEPCKICVSVASFGAATVAKAFVFSVDAATPRLVATLPLIPVSAQPIRAKARGPPLAS